MHPNGLLGGFKVRCWYMEDDVRMDICDDVIIKPHDTEYKFTDLESNKMYYFEVIPFSVN